MASTYSTNLAIELIGTGDQAGTWGVTTNTNLGTLIEQAISGYVTQAVATGTDTTITIPNGATGVARNMYIELTGTGGANTNLIVPANRKLYFIFNNSTGQVTVKVAAQTGVSVPAGAKVILVSNGTDIVNATDYIRGDSANITVLTSSSATITNLLGTTLSFGSASLSNADILSATITSATITGAGITSAAITTLTATSSTITTLTGTTLGYDSASLSNLKAVSAVITSASVTGLGVTSANITTLTGTTASYGSASLTNLNVSASATLARFSAGSSAVSNLLASGAITAVGNISTSGNLSASGSITASSGVITQFNSTSATITTLKATSATLDNVSFTSIVLTNATVTSANITTLTGTTVSYGSGSLTGLNAVSANIATLTGTTLGYASASITTVTGTTIGAALSSTILGISGSITNLNSTSANITTLTGTTLGYGSASITTVTGATIGTTASATIRGVSGVIGQFNATSATITTLTGTSSTITTIASTSATITTLTGTTVGYGSASLTNMKAVSAVITSATVTGLGVTSAAITTLTGTTLGYASASVTNINIATSATIGRFNAGSSAVGNLFASGTIQTSGNIGVGTAVSAWTTPFSVMQLGATYGAYIAGQNNGADLKIGTNNYYNGTNYVYTASNAPASRFDVGQSGAPGFAWNVAASGTVGGTISFTQAMTLNASGNLGIGTTSPGAKLDVQGDIILSAANATITFNSGGPTIICPTANTLAFTTSGTERARITSGGDVYIATASALANTAKLQISNGTGRSISTMGSSGDAGTESIRIGKYDNDSTTSQIFVKFTINNDGSGSGQINANGASAAAFGTFSDARLKENIQDLPSQLSNICALRPVEFDYKDGSGHQIGFVAQEMQTVYPDVVSPSNNEMLTVTGWSKTEARLVKAIQELKAELDATKAEVAALKGA